MSKIHDPEYIKAKRDKEQAKYDAKHAEQHAYYVREAARRTATEGLSTEELQALTPALLRAAIPMRDALEVISKQYRASHIGIGIALSQKIKAGEKALSQAKEGEK